MKEEVLAAVMFFIRFIEKSDKFPRDQLDNFKRHLTDLLLERFDKHWFPEVPTRGQGYRCIRVNGVSPIDWTLDQAATKCGLSYSDLRLPQELTVWVDPTEVCYRLGESEGSYCTLATFPSECSSSASSCGSESGTSTPVPPCSPPGTPLHHQTSPLTSNRKVQKSNNNHHYHHHHNNHHHHHHQQPRYNSTHPAMDYHQKYPRMGPLPSSLRVKQSPREMNFNFNQGSRPSSSSSSSLYRCDGPPYPLTAPAAFYRNINYSRNYNKNVLRV